MTTPLKQFDALLVHLNAEDNEMAASVRKEIEFLQDRERMAYCLTACGVDNWEGNDAAVEMYFQLKEAPDDED